MSDTSSLSVERRRKQGRSSVTNGKRVLIGVRGSSKYSRRYADLIELFTAEIGGSLSASEGALVKQAAALQVQSEKLQARIVNGDDVPSDDVIRVSSECRRILDALNAKTGTRGPKPGASLDDHIARRLGERVQADEAA